MSTPRLPRISPAISAEITRQASSLRISDVYGRWTSMYPADDIHAFVQWVRNATGTEMMALLDPDEVDGFVVLLGGKVAGPNPEVVDAILEGLEAGP